MPDILIQFLFILGFLGLLRYCRSYLLTFFVFTLAAVLTLHQFQVFSGLTALFDNYIYRQVTDPVKAAMTAFIAFYCGYVGLMEYGGPIKGFTQFFEAHSGGAVKTQIMAWAASVGAFFSDLGSPGIVGTVFRSRYSREGVTREKLALLINFTAVPVCSMIPLVGWGLFAISVLYGTVDVLQLEIAPIGLFLKSVPHFCFSALAIVTPLLLLHDGLCIGSLRQVQRELSGSEHIYCRARKPYEVHIELADEEGSGLSLVLSILVLLGLLFLCLSAAGQGLFSVGTGPFMTYLAIAIISAALSVMVFMNFSGRKGFLKAFSLYTSMFKRVLSVTGIMVMSWIFFQVAFELGIYQGAAQWMGQTVPGFVVLPLLFSASCILSSWTGSAWGTYGVILPLAVMLGSIPDLQLSLYTAVGAAVSGGVLGDISAKNSHAMHYSAESAGVDPAAFSDLQRPYIRMMGISCLIAYTAGFWLTAAAAQLAAALTAYVLQILFMSRKIHH